MQLKNIFSLIIPSSLFKMKPIHTLLCAVLLTLASQVSGQNMSTSFTAVPSLPNYLIGSEVRVQLNVTNFTNISSVLLPITYNASVLRFDSIDLPVIPEYPDTTLMFHPNPGVIKIVWFPSLILYPNGVNIAGTNSRMLTLCFTVLGNGMTDINLSTTVPNTPIEVINAMGNQVYSNNIFQTGGSIDNGVTIVGGDGITPPPPLVGFKIVATDVYAKQGHRVCVPIAVNDFDSMQLLQYAMHWDNSKLTYDCIRGATSPIVPTINPPAAAPGTLLLQWEDPNLLSGIGVSKPDGTRIFEVCFNTIGAPGSESPFTIDGFGFGFPPDFNNDFAEAANAMGNNVWETSGPNGASGVNATVYIMSDPPGGFPVTYTAKFDTIAPNATSCVPVKVKNFTAITEAEFLMQYDATLLTYSAPVDIPVTTLGLVPSNITHSVTAGTGTIKFKWSKAAGATVADNTTIFSPCFMPIGPDNTAVPLTFNTSACPSPTPFATYKLYSGGRPYKMEDGQVFIKAASGPPTATAMDALCPIGATGSLSCTPNGDATGYVWSFMNKTTQNVSNVPAGVYTVTVTYASGIMGTATATVGIPSFVGMTQAVTGVNCFGESNGAIDITPEGGTGTYNSYQWTGPGGFSATTQDISGVPTGNYKVTITDSNGCVFISPLVNVSQPQAISVPSNSTIVTDVSCFGGSNGAVSIVPQGGSVPYTFDWSNDGPDDPDNDPQNIVGLIAGNVVVTITDAHGCSFTHPGITVSSPQQLVPTFIQKQDVSCFGSATGSATITVNGGTGNKTYSWKTVPGGVQVSTMQNPNNLAPGTYNVMITDANGCTASLLNDVTIVNPTSALSATSTSTPGTCFGAPTGCIDLSPVGGWGGYQYAWSSGLDPIQDPCGISSGTYTVTITDSKLCTTTNTVVVDGPQTAIAIGNPIVSNVSCFGLANGGICLNLSGGAGAPYSVAWSNTPLTGACIGNLQGGNYAPTVTDAQGCTNVFAAVQVIEPMILQLDTTVTAANPMGAIDLTVNGGSPNYTYQWTGPGGFSATTEDINAIEGTYTVTVTDANGCSKIGVYSIPLSNVMTGHVHLTNISNSCNDDGCIYLSIDASAAVAAPFTVSWTGGELPASSSLNPSICGLSVGIYSVTVTASNGNSAVVTNLLVNQLQPASAAINTQQPTGALQNGSITLTPNFPSTYLWNNGSTAANLSSLDSGLYVVTITNSSSGCTSVYQIPLVRQYPPYSPGVPTIDDPSCLNFTDGAITLAVEGGIPPLTYQWSNGQTSRNLSGMGQGTYTVTVTQGNGSTNVHGPWTLNPQSNLAISNVNELSLTPGGTQVSGANTCDGEAAVVFGNGVGNTSILWSNGVTTVNNASLCGGNYSVTVTDELGCTAAWSDALTVPAAITASSTGISPTCFGDKNGSAKVFVSGGIEPYEVFWDNGQFDQVVFSNTFSEAVSLVGGDYGVTITDVNNVSWEITVNVPQPQPLEVTFTTIDPFNFNSCDGERIAFVTGAVDPITYTWSGSFGHSGDTERAEGLCAGEILYYEISDSAGCSVSVVDTIPYPKDGCFHVRPVLTPAEQDGNNDYTMITCIEGSTNTVEIYNRWGQLVFQTDNYSNNPGDPSNTWTGFTRTGAALPEGVYFYVLTYLDDQNNQHQLKGHINLLK